jgi:hypothetical protein
MDTAKLPEVQPEPLPPELIRTALALRRRGVPIRRIAEFFAADVEQVRRTLELRR